MSEKYENADKREIQRKIGRQVRRWRVEMGITQESLGELVNLSTTTISRLETGSQCVSAVKLVEIADALKVNAALLFSDFRRNETHQSNGVDEEIVWMLEGFSQREKKFILDYLRNFLEFNMEVRE